MRHFQEWIVLLIVICVGSKSKSWRKILGSISSSVVGHQ